MDSTSNAVNPNADPQQGRDMAIVSARRRFLKQSLLAAASAATTGLGLPGAARAEANRLRISRGYGVYYLPFYVMEAKGFLQARAAAAGLGEVAAEYMLIDGGNNINDAMLAGAIDIASTGLGGFLTLWAKAKGNPKAEVIGLGGAASSGMVMTSRNPALKSLRDVAETDRIAVPGVKTSLGAVILHMAVAKEFGDAAYNKFDHLTVGLAYPEAVAAMTSSRTEITAHVASAPFYYIELNHPGIHMVFNSVDLFGPLTTIMAFTTERFRDANPKLTASFVAALKDANEFIAGNKREAALIYLKAAKVKTTEADLMKVLEDPDLSFSAAPNGTMLFANFMHRVGTIKIKPEAWSDVFVPELKALPGN
jgi:NitT/TauT family transport system substrate-binding protein